MPNPAEPTSQNAPQPPENYPTPLSPPLPAISKDIELTRAMSASSKSDLYKLSRSDVLYEDEWLMAVNKPQGVYCESILASVPRLLAGDSDESESGRLSAGTQLNLPELHLANRLDRDTSGVMVITKSHKVASKLVKAFTDHKVRKTYVALCIGPAPKWERITIKSGHGRSKFGVWRVYAASDVGRTLPGGSVVRDMVTSFEVLSVNGQGNFKEPSEFQMDEENTIIVGKKAVIDGDAKKNEILVRAFPRSGRTHQIRLHCQYLGISIRGDVKYEGFYEWNGRIYEGHELHAESLSLEHPVTGCPVMFHAPLPSWATQGFAVGSDALVSLALFVSRAGIKTVDVLTPKVAIVGAMLPYCFSAITVKECGKCSSQGSLGKIIRTKRVRCLQSCGHRLGIHLRTLLALHSTS